MLTQYFRALVGLVYPPCCWVCGELVEEQKENLCAYCLEELETPEEAICPRCGAFLGPHARVGRRCWYCRNLRLGFDEAVAAGRYGGRLRELLLRFKFGRQRELSRLLSSLMISALERRTFLRGGEVVLAVPLHWWRAFRRGFNQSVLLARDVASHFGLAFLPAELVRTRMTADQTRLMPIARVRNVKGAFGVRHRGKLSGKSVLLVDDILTTGATASECARALKRAGARKVKVVVVARAT